MFAGRFKVPLCTAAAITLSACASLPALNVIQSQPPNTVKRTFVDGTYGQVHVRIAVPPNGVSVKTPLVLLHPSPYSSQAYLPFIEDMRSDRLIIAMDTPGYGDSDDPSGTPSMQNYAANAIRVLDELGITEPVNALGYHTGTLIAAEMALTQPARINKLVLAGVPVYPPERLPELYSKYAKPDILKADGSHLKAKWDFARISAPAGVTTEQTQENFNDSMQSMPNSTRAYYTVFAYPGYERFPQMTRPTLFVSINGSLNTETKDAHALTPGSEWIYLEDVPTGLFEVAHTEMAKLARDYLDRNTSNP